MGEPAQGFVATEMVDDGLADHRAEAGHAVGQPLPHAAAMKWSVGGWWAVAGPNGALLVGGTMTADRPEAFERND